MSETHSRLAGSSKPGSSSHFADTRQNAEAQGSSSGTLPGSVTLECRYGTLSFFQQDEPIGRSLQEYGEWAQDEINFLQTLIQPGDTVLDVGANIGTHTLAFARLVGPTGRVLAFEPQGPVAQLLRQNVEQNSLTNVLVHAVGLSDVEGEMRVPRLDYSARGNFGGIALGSADALADDAVPVWVTTVDSLQLEACNLLKIDVEGMEAQVIGGAQGTIARFRPVLYCECNTVEVGWRTIGVADKLGYAAIFHRSKAFNAENFRHNDADMFGMAHETNLVLVPSERLEQVQTVLTDCFDVHAIRGLDDLARAVVETPRAGSRDYPAELENAERKLREYHESLHVQIAENSSLHRRLGDYHSVMQGKDEEIKRLTVLLAGSPGSGSAAPRSSQRAELRATAATYHEAPQPRTAEAALLHQKLSEYHRAVFDREAKIGGLKTKLEAHTRACASLLAEGAGLLFASLDTAAHLDFPVVQGSLTPAERSRLRVLYVTDRDDAPYRYRCVNACQQLRESGVIANIQRLDEDVLLRQIERYSVVVLFRLPWSETVESVISQARRAGAAVVFDIDDLIFDPSVEHLLPFLTRFEPAAVAEYRRTFAALHRTFLASDYCIVSTLAIAERARGLNKEAVVHPNLLSREYVELSQIIYPLRRRLQTELLIGYMSGSNTHDGDIESIAAPLQTFMRERPDAAVLLVGHVEAPKALAGFRERVLCVPYQDRRVYPWLMARCRVLLAPIERVNEFANAKSGLKVFEGGVFGVPAIASPIAAYQEAVFQCRSGIIASTETEWLDGLRRLDDPLTSQQFGEAAHAVALSNYSPDSHLDELAGHLLARNGRHKGEEPALQPLDATRWPARRAAAAASASELVMVPRRLSLERECLDADALIGRYVAAAERDGDRLVLGGETIGWIVADRERPLDRLGHCDGVRKLADQGTGAGFFAEHSDVRFWWDAHHWQALVPTIMVAQLRVRTGTGRAEAQLYWTESTDQEFHEDRTLRFPLRDDGEMHTYVVPLMRPTEGPLFQSGVRLVRFDPLQTVGEAEVGVLAFLVGRPDLDALPLDLRRDLAQRFLADRGVEIGALQNPMPLPPRASVVYVDRITLTEARVHYPELEGQLLVAPTIICEADALTPVPSDSVNFVVCNHVLEHVKDPLSGLREWLRILRPGGHLYVSIPDIDNPHDRTRALTTFEHLLADTQHRGDRAAQDVEHYNEWARAVRPAESEAGQRAHAESLIRQGYSIHFHVFDRSLFERVLEHVLPRCGARLVELVTNPTVELTEHIAVIRKEFRPEGPAAQSETGHSLDRHAGPRARTLQPSVVA